MNSGIANIIGHVPPLPNVIGHFSFCIGPAVVTCISASVVKAKYGRQWISLGAPQGSVLYHPYLTYGGELVSEMTLGFPCTQWNIIYRLSYIYITLMSHTCITFFLSKIWPSMKYMRFFTPFILVRNQNQFSHIILFDGLLDYIMSLRIILNVLEVPCMQSKLIICILITL